MRADQMDLRELLEARAGTLRLAGQRAALLDATALGLLRRLLIEGFGGQAARHVLSRFGYIHGWRLAETLRTEIRWESEDDWIRAAAPALALQGLVEVETPAPGPLARDGQSLAYSFEAEQHLGHLGRSQYPVCWTICGALSGYLSQATRREIYVLEDRCVGTGDAACHVVGRTKEEWGAERGEELGFLTQECITVCIDGSLHGVVAELKRAEAKLRERRRALGRILPRQEDDGSGLIARSRTMRQLLDLARRVSKVDSTVLVTGESGTGKERVAHLLHEESARADGPFVAVNCGAIPEALLESELFGHARGAFTGASQDRPGLFEAAAGGTLLLDEIGEIPPAMQVKLLRALQERTVRRVGENHDRPVDVRIIAATHRDLGREVSAGRFRQDLLYRLKVVELRVPALRERHEDILPLARLLLAEAAARMKRPISGLTASAADQLLRYEWPGNVRELENAMERAAALASSTRADLDDLPEEVRHALPAPSISGGQRTLEQVERDHILSTLDRNGGNQTLTARTLGIGSATLYRKLKSYGLIEPRSAARA